MRENQTTLFFPSGKRQLKNLMDKYPEYDFYIGLKFSDKGHIIVLPKDSPIVLIGKDENDIDVNLKNK